MPMLFCPVNRQDNRGETCRRCQFRAGGGMIQKHPFGNTQNFVKSPPTKAGQAPSIFFLWAKEQDDCD